MKKYQSIFLSDIHLGSQHCQSDKLFKELQKIDAKNLFLVGDIITQNAHADHPDIVKFKELINSRDWNIIYILGNHEKDRKKPKIELAPNLQTYTEYIYKNSKENIYLTHGDSFHSKDLFNKLLKFTLSKIKKRAQKIADKQSNICNPSTIYHKKVKPLAQKYLHNSYVKYICHLAQKNNCQKAICGHIHLPETIKHPKTTYLNCGDWINHASYITEDINGEFKLNIL